MNEFQQLINPYLLHDIYYAERSLELNKQIHKQAKTLPQGVKYDIALIMYNLSFNEMILSLARLYDKPHSKYPTRCIKGLYDLARRNDYPDISEIIPEVLLYLESWGFKYHEIALLQNSSSKDFIRRSLEHFEFIEDNEPLSNDIKRLKDIRDKRLAHNEATEIDDSIPYESMERLIKHSQNVVSFMALAFCELHLSNGLSFTLSHAAQHWKYTFNEFSKA